MGTNKLTRRRFLGAAAGLPFILPARAWGQTVPPPSERIHVGLIGIGGRGLGNLDRFLRQDDVQVVAIADVDRLHYRDRPWEQGTRYGREAAKEAVERRYSEAMASGTYKGLKVHSDYREACADPEIDAVVISTPDHWHALCTLEALRHGKDVFCEKPVTHLFAEGQAIYREAARRGAIFQVGSQQRSDKRFRHAANIVRNGLLGKIMRVEVGLPAGFPAAQGDSTITEPPEHVDYDFWCGPGEKLPFMAARFHRWWRGHRAYGGGNIMDWIGHHNDIAHWALDLDRSGPTRVEAKGWTFPEGAVYNTPIDYEILCEYPGGLSWSLSSKNPLGTKIIGEDGWVYVSRSLTDSIELEASDPRWVDESFDPGPVKVYVSNDHTRNFIDGCKTRTACICPAETGHRSITPGHLGFVSQALGRPLRWDPSAETVTGDAEAQSLLMLVDYRAPWGWSP
ncbi:MAG: Gfo/Idh/MocA family oxidoreductase [Candidatus Hydrogenedentes bacterium]|nr:Gfo/Idh/MocA family oxidoreductase [Candidatus Hydrogenedentota bacterium]